MEDKLRQLALRQVWWMIAACIFTGTTATAGGKVSVYGVRMVPYGTQAESYSRPGWGGGLRFVLPVPQVSNTLAGTFGFEVVNLLSHTETFWDRTTNLQVDQETDQNYIRLYLGAQVGGHGNGFLRPHAGVNIALVHYSISTDNVVPDTYDPGNEIRQNLRDEGRLVFGYDFTLGLDLNFSNKLALDGGVRYLKSFALPQQLGAGSVKIYPQYFQIYFEVGFGFDFLQSLGSDDQE